MPVVRLLASRSFSLVSALALASLAAGAAPAPRPAPTPAVTAEQLAGLEFRSIGPAIMGGRIDDFAVVESDPATFYVATASGGVFKTINGGTTFAPVFDDQATSSIGDVTVAPSDPQVVWVGTGEPNNRQSSSWGNGVYRSTDGGASWTHAGLAETHHIGRIVVHPTNPEVAYVAALGRLWGPNPERGLYKTTDGGRTWALSKFVDADTGFVDVAIDPQSPDTVYAAAYQRRRTPFGYNGGGPGSGIWKTTDGGRSWKKLGKGLPADGDVGRIGLAVYRKEPRIVYALVEHAKEQGIYRSEDRGETFVKMSDTNPRPSYYSKLHVDPNNDLRVWVLGAPIYHSQDGGKTFKTDRGEKIHGDYHGMWIDPRDSDHMLVGTDGGIHVSRDAGRNWDFVNTIPLAQFYEVTVDNRTPYRVCGGLQDNGSWCGPSRTFTRQGVTNEDWFRVGGGDGFFVRVDPSDPDTLYQESQDGNLGRVDLRTGERRNIRPEPPAGERYRFNWNSPVEISQHDPKVVYYGGNRLLRSTNRGDDWTPISPDLTRAEKRDELTIFGKAAKDFLSRNDGVVHWGTITTFAESPLDPKVLWAGTDDGRLHVTRDLGQTWTELFAPGVPKGTYVSRVEAGRAAAGTATVAFDGHRGNDFTPWVFRTDDFGRTWTRIFTSIPEGSTVSVVREHPANPGVLLCGTERGLWISFDRGATAVRMTGKLPMVPVDDLVFHPAGDLVVGTHGRGVYVLDDASVLAKLAPTPPALAAFEPRPAVAWRLANHKGDTGARFFVADNPPEGALVSYFLKAKPGDKDKAEVVVRDAAGAVVRKLEGGRAAGFNRVAWDLRGEPPVKPEPGAGGFGGPPRGPLVEPGRYTLELVVGSEKASVAVAVEEDPRVAIAAADRAAWSAALRAAARVWARADAADKRVAAAQKQLKELQAALGKAPKASDPLKAAVKAALEAVEPQARALRRDVPMGFAGAPLASEPDPLLPRARGVYFSLSSYTAAPTAQQERVAAEVARQVDAAVVAANALSKTLADLNRQLFEEGFGRLDPGTPIE